MRWYHPCLVRNRVGADHLALRPICVGSYTHYRGQAEGIFRPMCISTLPDYRLLQAMLQLSRRMRRLAPTSMMARGLLQVSFLRMLPAFLLLHPPASYPGAKWHTQSMPPGAYGFSRGFTSTSLMAAAAHQNEQPPQDEEDLKFGPYKLHSSQVCTRTADGAGIRL